MPSDAVQTSKFLSLVLRHKPDEIGITLDSAGWIDVDELLRACAAHGKRISREELDALVGNSDKQRFAFSDDHTRIRANQGHSVQVELDYKPATPPDVLYHGTPEKFVETILREGLKKMQRHHVHLSPTHDTATKVGERRGKPVILRIDSKQMHADGFTFYLTPNQVWLVDEVPRKYLSIDVAEGMRHHTR
jgi:putative RNA 2'-phosphotransferase